MKFNSSNNHIVVCIDNNNYVVDTGAPYSFTYTDTEEITINNKKYKLSETVLAKKDEVEELVNCPVHGLIGMDIISSTGLTIDYQNQEIEFSTDKKLKPVLPIVMLLSYITTKMSINNTPDRKVVIDTGAIISYVSSKCVGNEVLNETYKDYSPQFGVLEGNLYKVNISSSSISKNIKAGKMSQKLEMCGFDAVIGTNQLTDSVICFDFEDKVIRI